MTPDWVDVRIPAEVDSGELLGLLGDPLVQGAWEDQGMISSGGWRLEQTGRSISSARPAPARRR